VNFKSPSGRPVLFQAVEDDMMDIVKFLLEAGAEPNINDGVIIALSLCLLFIYFDAYI
jgi:hypothetical protein